MGVPVDRVMRSLAFVVMAGCAYTADLGVLQRNPGDVTGGTIKMSTGVGLVPRDIVALNVDFRGDISSSEHASGQEAGSRFAVGMSALGGVPVGPGKILGRVGFWHSGFSQIDDRTIVPTFELMGYAPLADNYSQKHPEYGASSAGVIFGVREDLDHTAYTTFFVGLAMFLLPGY
ncbi:MAG: hypothetical protein QM831_24895 [Kofleriaceae bacterium]